MTEIVHEVTNQLTDDKILKDIPIPDRTKAWTINSLRPGLSDTDLASELAVYFVRITDEFTPLNNQAVPITFSRPYTNVQPHEVAQRKRSSKRVKSAVDGDILPCLASNLSDLTAVPATRIINYALQTLHWPALWKIETQTAIQRVTARQLSII